MSFASPSGGVAGARLGRSPLHGKESKIKASRDLQIVARNNAHLDGDRLDFTSAQRASACLADGTSIGTWSGAVWTGLEWTAAPNNSGRAWTISKVQQSRRIPRKCSMQKTDTPFVDE